MPRQPLALAPFRGLRYTDLDVGRILDSGEFEVANLLAPPYDIPGPEETLELLRSDPHNAAYLTVPYQLNLTMPGSCGGQPAGFIYEKAAARLNTWIDDGVLAQDPAAALYVYEQVTVDGTRQRGLIGALSLPSSTAPGPVRPHEQVEHGPVGDRTLLMSSTRANLEPIFLLYPGGNGAATQITEDAGNHGELLVETHTADGTRHRLWAMTDPATHSEIEADLAPRTALIADGHHRYAAYQRMHEYGDDPGWAYGLAYLVDSDANPPALNAIHRVVPKLTADQAAESARSVARVERLDASCLPEAERTLAKAKHPALLLADPSGGFHLVSGFNPRRLAEAAPSRSDAYRELPTTALHHVLLPLWDIPDHRVRMVHDDSAEAIEAARQGEGTAVIVPPLSVEQVYAVAEHGELTPRKSTSFGPKPRSGLVMRVLP
ncbi:DUF1015 family protein [Nocardiopsis lucentensis]|uniref:DUF1015 family protein n=1 Tax=Nocardiopsis lucentensis TaxID=53441 RepID=UPI00034925C5|nr:DUF1015 domain-containing protein [Nocardiopsis lucentensis]